MVKALLRAGEFVLSRAACAAQVLICDSCQRPINPLTGECACSD